MQPDQLQFLDRKQLLSEEPLDKITARLDGVQSLSNGQIRAICPAHISKHRSRTLSIKETSEGNVLLHCFAGCGGAEIMEAIGLQLSDLFPQSHETKAGRPFTKKVAFTAREALQILSFEITVASVFVGDVIAQRDVSDDDWNRFLLARDRISTAAMEYL